MATKKPETKTFPNTPAGRNQAIAEAKKRGEKSITFRFNEYGLDMAPKKARKP